MLELNEKFSRRKKKTHGLFVGRSITCNNSYSSLFKTLGTKAMEEVGKRTGQEVFDNRQTILGAVKDLLVGEELTTLGLLEKYPDNEDIQSEVVETIETKLKASLILLNA
jgi:hypothetical protein